MKSWADCSKKRSEGTRLITWNTRVCTGSRRRQAQGGTKATERAAPTTGLAVHLVPLVLLSGPKSQPLAQSGAALTGESLRQLARQRGVNDPVGLTEASAY